MEPKIGTNAYLISLLNPFRRPLCSRHVNRFVLKIFGGVSILMLVALAWLTRDHGLLGLGVASVLTITYVTAIVLGIELAFRLTAITENFHALLSNWKSPK